MPLNPPEPEKRRCTALRAGGAPCRGWAVRGSDPPLCGAHGGGLAPIGAPSGNQNACRHGFYSRVLQAGELAGLVECAANLSLEDEIATARIALRRLMTRLGAGALETKELNALVALVFNGTRTISRLLRDQRSLSGESADGLAGAIGAALDELGTEMGIEL